MSDFKMSLWQAESLAEWMRENDNPADETLNTAHATLRVVDDENHAIEVCTDAGARLVMWHDGSDCTDDYPVQS